MSSPRELRRQEHIYPAASFIAVKIIELCREIWRDLSEGLLSTISACEAAIPLTAQVSHCASDPTMTARGAKQQAWRKWCLLRRRS